MLNTPCNGRIATTVPGITSWADDTDLKCWFSLTTIASYQADYTIYNDGSTSRGTKNGGGAAVIIRGSPNQVTTIKTKGRKFTSSYEEEAAAMESTLLWTSTNTNHCSISLLSCTDSKSLYEALISSNPWTSSIHNSINLILSSIFIQWIPGHSAIPGNYLANKAAKEVTNIAINAILPIFFSSFIQLLMKQFVMIHQHTSVLHLCTNITRLLVMWNRSKIEKITYCLLVCNLFITLLFRSTCIDLTHLKMLSAQNATSMNKISVADSAIALPSWL